MRSSRPPRSPRWLKSASTCLYILDHRAVPTAPAVVHTACAARAGAVTCPVARKGRPSTCTLAREPRGATRPGSTSEAACAHVYAWASTHLPVPPMAPRPVGPACRLVIACYWSPRDLQMELMTSSTYSIQAQARALCQQATSCGDLGPCKRPPPFPQALPPILPPPATLAQGRARRPPCPCGLIVGPVDSIYPILGLVLASPSTWLTWSYMPPRSMAPPIYPATHEEAGSAESLFGGGSPPVWTAARQVGGLRSRL